MDYPYNLGSYTRKVTATSADAQRWFDRGLNWCFGYHHEEAVACFEKTLETDPNCAMAHWGVAYGCGPFYNMTWRDHSEEEANAATGIAYEQATQAALTSRELQLAHVRLVRTHERNAVEWCIHIRVQRPLTPHTFKREERYRHNRHALVVNRRR